MLAVDQIRVDDKVQPSGYNGWAEPGCVISLSRPGFARVYWPETGLHSDEPLCALVRIARAPLVLV